MTPRTLTSELRSGFGGRPKARRLRSRDRSRALALLARHPRENLLLIDMVEQLGRVPAPGEERLELLGVFCGDALIGVAASRPSVVFAEDLDPAALDALMPYLVRLPAGLVKSAAPLVDRVWPRLAARGARVLVDRVEIAWAVEEAELRAAPAPPGARLRGAKPTDLDDLVSAARASLREEGRPDPHDEDPMGFRTWVGGRVVNARVVEVEGEIAFVAYADVRRPEGWLLQGVYTWPEHRRAGHAAAGVSDLCRRGFGAGASHVQLSVVEGNEPARRLYESLGFRPYARFRTILFH